MLPVTNRFKNGENTQNSFTINVVVVDRITPINIFPMLGHIDFNMSKTNFLKKIICIITTDNSASPGETCYWKRESGFGAA